MQVGVNTNLSLNIYSRLSTPNCSQNHVIAYSDSLSFQWKNSWNSSSSTIFITSIFLVFLISEMTFSSALNPLEWLATNSFYRYYPWIKHKVMRWSSGEALDGVNEFSMENMDTHVKVHKVKNVSTECSFGESPLHIYLQLNICGSVWHS